MAEFKTSLVVKQISESGNMWKVMEDLVYESDIMGWVVVPKGFVTDFASVPRLPLAYLLAGDTAHAAAVVHDYLYQVHAGTKSQADRTFYEAMKATHIPGWRRTVMYCAVSLGGWIAWWKGPGRLRAF